MSERFPDGNVGYDYLRGIRRKPREEKAAELDAELIRLRAEVEELRAQLSALEDTNKNLQEMVAELNLQLEEMALAKNERLRAIVERVRDIPKHKTPQLETCLLIDEAHLALAGEETDE